MYTRFVKYISGTTMMLFIAWCSVYAIFLIHSAKADTAENTSVCVDPLGIEEGGIPADGLSASSEKDEIFGAHRGRLNTQNEMGPTGAKGGWTANSNDADQWIQADLLAVKEVTGVITQGRNGGLILYSDSWVESYEALHSVDGVNFEIVLGATGETEEFSGNSDTDTAVTNMFNAAVHAQFIRIHPTVWHGDISLRFELLGCPVTTSSPEIDGQGTTLEVTTTRATTDEIDCQGTTVEVTTTRATTDESVIHSAFFKSSGKSDGICQRPNRSCTRCAMACMRALQCQAFWFDHNGCHLMPEFAGEQNMQYVVDEVVV